MTDYESVDQMTIRDLRARLAAAEASRDEWEAAASSYESQRDEARDQYALTCKDLNYAAIQRDAAEAALAGMTTLLRRYVWQVRYCDGVDFIDDYPNREIWTEADALAMDAVLGQEEWKK